MPAAGLCSRGAPRLRGGHARARLSLGSHPGWTLVQHRRSNVYVLIIVGYMSNTVLPARGAEVLRIFLLS
jgi:hypothetical protein